MVMHMMANGKMVKCMGLANMYIAMEDVMKGSGRIISSTAKEQRRGPMDAGIKGSIGRVADTEKDNTKIILDPNIQDSSKIISRMALVNYIGPMGIITPGSGNKIKCMGQAYFSSVKVDLLMDNGKKESNREIFP